MLDPTDATQLPESPYPGIEPYRYADRKIFFAREKESRSLIRLVVMYRGVLLYSDSGNGKSSLLNAGLMPQAIGEGFQPQRIRVQPRKGQEIVVERLSETVNGKLRLLPSILSPDLLQERSTLSVEKFLAILREQAGKVCPLLVFDQFEEWVTLFEEGGGEPAASEARESRKRIFDAVVSLINDAKLPVKVLISLREDYLAKLTPFFKQCPSLPDQYLRLAPLQGEEIFRVIRGPFEEYPGTYPREISAPLAQEIRSQFESRGENEIRLTEVQIVCQSLFESGKQGKELAEHFVRQGGVKGVLEQYLERALQSLDEGQREPAVCLLTRMVTSAGTRNVISGEDLLSRVENEDQIPRELLDTTLNNLEQNTKLVRREARREVYYYEISSEFLVDWIRGKAREHQRQAEQRKIEEAQREAEEQRRTARRRKQLTALAVATILLSVIAVYAWMQRNSALEARIKADRARSDAEASAEQAQTAKNDADLQRRRAEEETKNAETNAEEARRQKNRADREAKVAKALGRVALGRLLAVQADIARNTDLPESVLLAVEAKRYVPPDNSEVDQSLRAGLDLLPKAVAHLGVDRTLRAVVFSPNGKYLATGSTDKTARVWETTTGREIAHMVHESMVATLAFSPDGRYLATGGTGKIARVWETTTGREIARMVHESTVTTLAFSPDGKYLAAVGAGKTARVWETATGREVARIVHEGAVPAFAFSPDGKYLATVSTDKTARVSDPTTGREIARMKHEGSVKYLAFDADGKYLATGSAGKTARVWDPATGREIAFMVHEGTVTALGFSPDAKYLATRSTDRTARVWDPATGREVAQMVHNSDVTALAFAPDGKRLATATSADGARVWEASSGREVSHVAQSSRVTRLAFSPDGKYLATVSDYTAHLWEAAAGREVKRITHDLGITTLAFSPDGKVLVTASAGNVVVWEVPIHGEHELGNLAQEALATAVACSPNGNYLATVGRDGTAQVWEVAREQKVGDPLKHCEQKSAAPARAPSSCQALTVAFSPDGNYLATVGRDGTAQVWEAAGGRKVGDPLKHCEQQSTTPTQIPSSCQVLTVAFSSDGNQLVSGSRDKTAILWDIPSGQRRRLFPHQKRVTSVAFSGGSEKARIATGSDDGSVRIWDPSSGKELHRFIALGKSVGIVTFSPNGRFLAGMTPGGAFLWEVATGRTLWSRQYLNGLNLAFRPGGATLFMASTDGTVRELEANNGNEIARMTIEPNIISAAFSRNGKFFVTATGRGAVRIWEWQPENLIAEACSRLPRNMTVEEWQQYLRDEPYRRTCPNLPIETDLIEKGTELAGGGNLQGATAVFRTIAVIDPSLRLNPARMAGSIFLMQSLGRDLLRSKGEIRIDRRRIKEALQDYRELQKLDQTTGAYSDFLNDLCWMGSVRGHAVAFLDVCEEALRTDPENYHYRDSRGLARALTGNKEGAIEDFQAYVAQAEDAKRKEQRQNWIRALRAGENPFTPALLNTLISQVGIALER